MQLNKFKKRENVMVYVDEMEIKYKGMIMCYMIADTEEEPLIFTKI